MGGKYVEVPSSHIYRNPPLPPSSTEVYICCNVWTYIDISWWPIVHSFRCSSLLLFYTLWILIYVMTCIHQYGLISNSFTALKICCMPPVHPFLHNPCLSLVFSWLHRFAFSGILYCWNHTEFSVFRLASFTSFITLRFFCVFSCLESSFLFGTE